MSHLEVTDFVKNPISFIFRVQVTLYRPRQRLGHKEFEATRTYGKTAHEGCRSLMVETPKLNQLARQLTD